MNEPHTGKETIDNVVSALTRETVRKKFQADWELALISGEVPEPEQYVAALAEPERSICYKELGVLEKEFRRRLSRPAEPTSFHPSGAGQQEATGFHPSGLESQAHRTGQPEETYNSVPTPDDTSPPDGNADFSVNSQCTIDHTPSPAAGKGLKRTLPNIPGYEILGILGQGGMGVVFKARQVGLKRLVALKMIRGAQASEAELRRFTTEAEAIGRFQHPNIVQIYDIGEFQGEPYFSLELVDGGSLEKHVGGNPQPVRWAAGLAAELADAIGYAHDRNIIHRDLKPANVLLTTDHRPKVTDFGLAKRLEEDDGGTQTGTVMGTPSYMAPEQASGAKDLGPAADVYSLGAILYDLLTGRPPFKGSTIMETLDQVRKLEPVPPRALQPTMPRDLETICLKCLQKDPRRRYATAGEMAADLRRHLDGKPILARPVGRAERAWRWARRNPAWAAAIAGVSLLLLGWAATATAQFYEIRQAKKTSDQNRDTAEFNERQAKTNAELARQNENTAVKNAEEAKQERDRATRNADAVREQFQESVSRVIGLAEKTRAKLQPAPGQKPDPRARAVEDLILLEARDSLTTLGKSTDRTRASSFGTVLVHQKLGDLYRKFDRPKEAREQYKAGVQLTRDILQERPSPKGYGNLALMLNRLADATLEDDGDALAARELYREAVAVHQHSSEPEDTPAQLEGHRTAGATYRVNQGRIARLLGDSGAAATRLREAMEMRTAAAQGRPGDARLSSYLAEAELLFGDAAWRAGDKAGAEEALRRAVGRCEELAGRLPDLSFKSDVVFASVFLGDMLLATDRAVEALALYRKHIEPLQTIVAKSARPDYRAQLAQARGRVGLALIALGKPVEAAKEFEHSLKLWDSLAAAFPLQVPYESGRALALARCGQTRDATDALGALLVRLPKHTEVRYQAALCFARCVTSTEPDSERYANRAVELLRAAFKEGYRDRRTLQTEPDLKPLRGRPNFDALIASMSESE